MKPAVLVGALLATASCAPILGFDEDRLASDGTAGGQPGGLGGRSGAGQGDSGGVLSTAGGGGRDTRAGSGGTPNGGTAGSNAAGSNTAGSNAAGMGGSASTQAGSGGRDEDDVAGAGAAGSNAAGTGGSASTQAGSGGRDDVGGAGGAGGSEEPCAGKAGPVAVRVGSYCIDATEVTNAQYAEFLAAPPAPSTVAGCEWKPSFTPSEAKRGTEELPVGNVDWCDAKAYCQWAGKRLCGRVGDGANPPNDLSYVNEPALDEWYGVCSDGGDLNYSYGDAYDPTQCNSLSSNSRPVGTTPTCTSYHGRVFDLLGNVWEWVAACEPSPQAMPSEVRCFHRGGSHGFDDIRCNDTGTLSRREKHGDLGFRCCSD